jgi:hypothetical protein
LINDDPKNPLIPKEEEVSENPLIPKEDPEQELEDQENQ